MRVWVDLTNSPHVLVMRPVIERLRANGHEVQVTARDFAQTLALCDRFGIDHTAIGHHRGAGLGAKARGLFDRSAALTWWARGRGFDLALGHGSNDVTVAAAILRIPCSTTFDYEWATVQHTVNCRLADTVVVPELIAAERLYRYGAKGKIAAYPGLKEEYYLADFEPDPAILTQLSLDPTQPIVVVRTPPAVSLYHRFENDLFGTVLQRMAGTQTVVLPRTPEQRAELTAAGGFIVPEQAIDAQSLIAYADLMVSAGGTMNREAVALGTPVFTVFEGRLGAVDERLIADGRLRRLQSADEVVPVKRPVKERDSGARVRRILDCSWSCSAGPPVAVATADNAELKPGAAGPVPARTLDFRPHAPTDEIGGLSVHRHALPQLVIDGLLAALAYFLAFWLRLEGHFTGLNHRYAHLFAVSIWWVVLVTLLSLAAFGQYERLWKFVGQRDYEAVIKAVVVATLVIIGVIAIFHPVTTRTGAAVGLPGSVIALFFLLAAALLIAARFAVQFITDGRVRSPTVGKNARHVLIVGGGEGGRLVVRELLRNPDLNLRPVGFLDDDPRKLHSKDEHGLRILGATTEPDLSRTLDEVEPDEVIIAIPSASGELRGRVVTACRHRGIPLRTTPTVFELLRDGSGHLRVTNQLRQVRVEDILGREPVREQLEQVGAYLRGGTVMVTGAGGSIGSELCRQIARVGPARLVLVDHAEDNLFEIQRELEEDRHVRTAIPVLADCKEEERMREVFALYRPTVVFHAAAYKHVAMMESNPVEAVRNNALATRLVARIAGELGVETFVLVSTDKAVEPKTVMGASKALAEWAVEAEAARFGATRYATVRFGNVLGSSGSVVPIFRRQIAAGGPVTVTDERMKRYFMTIPEAVQLVIRAGSLSDTSGDVFVLEMGEAVSIMELAEQMIRLSGLEPERDIAIQITGARPGEKFDEQLFGVNERVHPTPAPRIMRADHDPLDPRWVQRIFDDLNLLVLEGDASVLAQHVAELSDARVTLRPTEDGRVRPVGP